jgi:hypothetical protein
MGLLIRVENVRPASFSGFLLDYFLGVCWLDRNTARGNIRNMPAKKITALGTYHQVQNNGHALNPKLASVISLLRENHPIQIILEEWWDGQQSFAATLATANLQWKNVGTPQEPRFETSSSGLNCYPPTHDPKKPMLQEYGPLNAQELREDYMVERIKTFMEPYDAGLFIVGLAHLHSILLRLKAVGFEVRGYSWIEQA